MRPFQIVEARLLVRGLYGAGPHLSDSRERFLRTEPLPNPVGRAHGSRPPQPALAVDEEAPRPRSARLEPVALDHLHLDDAGVQGE